MRWVTQASAGPVIDPSTVLVVEVDDLRVGLPVDVVAEVLRMVAVEELPGAPAVIAGVVDLRGRVVPVLDLRRRLGRTSREAALADRLVAVELDGRVLLVWVDAVAGLEHLASGAVEPLADGLAATAHLSGVARTEDGLLYVHDPAVFLTAREVAELDGLLLSTVGGA